MGFYNLPKDQQDNYNQEPTQEELREQWEKSRKEKINRSNKMLLPLSQEDMKSFLQRVVINDQQLEEQAVQEHMFGIRGAWYVHKRPQNCFICDLITSNAQKQHIISDILHLTPSVRKLRFNESEKGNTRRLGKR